jgi:hypothetical protein
MVRSTDFPVERKTTASALQHTFAIRHHRASRVGFHVVFTKDAIPDDFKMKLAHALNDGLAGFFVDRDMEGGVFF